MLELIRKLFIGHNHKWVVIRTVPVYEYSCSEKPYKIDHHLQCTECGNVKCVGL